MHAQSAPVSSLPARRADIIVHDVGHDVTGAAGLVLHDPLRHAYFRVGPDGFRMWQGWHLGNAQDVAAHAGVSTGDVEQFGQFLMASRLLVLPAGKHADFHAEYIRTRKTVLGRLVHSYLFFRVPLFNPERLLDFLLPLARSLASGWIITTIALVGLVGGYFTFRQWDVFAASFVDAFSLEGAVLYGVTLVGLKVLHEFGHGLVARHHGCRVPVIGVAFMMMAPMLYTEVSDAWRLSSRWQRFAIAAAGVGVELALAALALFAWAFLPDGAWRSAAYFVAATAWIMSLAVNLSPFMRFDGYHMLGDAVGLANIGPRAFALANWCLRQVLFASDEAAPEFFAPGVARFLVAFAWGTMIYRLTLFLGIAWLIYTMLPKAVGLPLAVVEILFFVLLPIWKELKEWHAMGWRKLFSKPRGLMTAAVTLVLVILAALPLDRSIHVPAIMVPAQETWVYPPEPAQVVSISVQTLSHVSAGQVIAVLHVPDIGQAQRLAQLRQDIVEGRLQRLAADQQERAQKQILEEERQSLIAEMDGLRKRGAPLTVRAPISGMVTARAETLRAGQWVGQGDVLFHIAAPQAAVVTGLVGERFAERLSEGATAEFIAEDGAHRPVSGYLAAIGVPGGEGDALPYLAQQNGGPVVAAADPMTGQLKAVQGHLPVRIDVARAAPERVLRGTAIISATPQSLLDIAFGRLVTVFLRESGF